MANLSGKKLIGGTSGTDGLFSNEERWFRVPYDFTAQAGGTAADYGVIENASDVGYVVTDFYHYTETAMASSGTCVIDLGIDAGGVEFLSQNAFGSFAALAVVGMDTAAPVYLASGSSIILGIEDAAVTAGKVHFYFKLRQLNVSE